MDVDLTGLTGLGTGAVVLVLIFRTLWRTDDSWKALLDAERRRAEDSAHDAEAARADAATAREDAAVARSDAADARAAAKAAQKATLRCEEEHRKTAAEFGRLVAHLRNLGLPIPTSVDDPQ